jgi:uncharacterized protein with PQ loop repeat
MLFHQHLRKRRSQKYLEPYPAKNIWLRWLDRIIFVAGVAGPIATIPQLINIYGSQTAGNISPITFGCYAAFNIIWIFYGLAHREPPIVMTYCLWFVANSAVCIGALIYAH